MVVITESTRLLDSKGVWCHGCCMKILPLLSSDKRTVIFFIYVIPSWKSFHSMWGSHAETSSSRTESCASKRWAVLNSLKFILKKPLNEKYSWKKVTRSYISNSFASRNKLKHFMRKVGVKLIITQPCNVKNHVRWFSCFCSQFESPFCKNKNSRPYRVYTTATTSLPNVPNKNWCWILLHITWHWWDTSIE